MSFYNTIGLNSEEFKLALQNCNKQEYYIMLLFADDEACTPFEIQERYNALYPDIPITSVRRAMTDLTKKGLLAKSDKKVERYGKMNHTWTKL